jgi:hypothetical protein
MMIIPISTPLPLGMVLRNFMRRVLPAHEIPQHFYLFPLLSLRILRGKSFSECMKARCV